MERRQELGDISCSYPKKKGSKEHQTILYSHYWRNDEGMRAGKENLPLELKRSVEDRNHSEDACRMIEASKYSAAPFELLSKTENKQQK